MFFSLHVRYGIANVCEDARSYMSEDWVAENCAEPSIKNLAVVQLAAASFSNSKLGFSTALRTLTNADGDEEGIVAFGCPYFNSDNRGMVYTTKVNDLLEISNDRIFIESVPTAHQYGFSLAMSDAKIFIGAPALGSSSPGTVTIGNYYDTHVPCATPLSTELNCISTDNTDDLTTSSQSGNGDHFGYSMALDTNFPTPGHLVVTACQEAQNGYATLYDLSDDSEIISWLSTDATSYYGFSSALQADNVVIGAPNFEDAGEKVGAVYVYSIDTQAQTELIIGTGLTDQAFGYSVAIMGGMCLYHP